MITLIVGLVLLALPFVLISLFSNKKQGFIYVLLFLMFFQSVLGLLVQSLGIFYYWVIFACTLLADIVVVFIYLTLRHGSGQETRKGSKPFGFFNLKNIDWIVLAVALISLLTLYQVHYNFTGQISSATDTSTYFHQVKNMVYPYPYFSDEWYAVSLVQGSITNHNLPFNNILNNTFFPNLELFFHSFVSEIILLLGLNPITQYTALSLFINTLIILLIYLFLRISNISKLVSGICSLLALYIIFGGNLPGLWHLIPFNIGIIFFLLSLCLMEFADVKFVFIPVILGSLFYPPLFPFYFLALVIFLFQEKKLPKEQIHKLTPIISGCVVAIAFVLCLIMFSPFAKALTYIFSRIFSISLTAPSILLVNFYDIIPLPAILLAVFGIYYLYRNKKRVLLSELILGTIFWLFYEFSNNRFFIDPERVFIITSIIVVIISGFGLSEIEKYIEFKFRENGRLVFKIFGAIALLVFLFLIPFYTQGENWKKFVLVNPEDGSIQNPKAPVNNYLTADDLKIFKDIKNKNFLSVAWKGTVIGVATNNYPVLTKKGTISIGSGDILNSFLKADCQGRNKLVKNLKLDYIYLYEIDCPGFKKIDQSQEGFMLYKTP
ncbi:MAG: hypothetical protein NTY04_02395 [Candidatus Staskawiczbacteria bacterium]|nr:hypothetical protein [Candidatus Staskawiczbacteria bacterium]